MDISRKRSIRQVVSSSHRTTSIYMISCACYVQLGYASSSTNHYTKTKSRHQKMKNISHSIFHIENLDLVSASDTITYLQIENVIYRILHIENLQHITHREYGAGIGF